MWQELDFDSVKTALKETGVKLISMCTTEFNMTDVSYREKWLSGLEKTCIAANDLGVEKLITQVGQDIGTSREEQHQTIVDTLKLAVPILERHKVTIMIEPLNTYVDHPGYFLWTSEEGFDIVREVNNPYVKIIYDIYHQQIMEGNLIPNITQNLDCIAHLHGAGHPGRNEMQYGECNYKNIFKAIDEAGYTGYCGLEYTPLLDPIESLIKAKEIFG